MGGSGYWLAHLPFFYQDKMDIRAKIMNLKYYRIRRCCGVQMVHSYQQHRTILLRLNRV